MFIKIYCDKIEKIPTSQNKYALSSLLVLTAISAVGNIYLGVTLIQKNTKKPEEKEKAEQIQDRPSENATETLERYNNYNYDNDLEEDGFYLKSKTKHNVSIFYSENAMDKEHNMVDILKFNNTYQRYKTNNPEKIDMKNKFLSIDYNILYSIWTNDKTLLEKLKEFFIEKKIKKICITNCSNPKLAHHIIQLSQVYIQNSSIDRYNSKNIKNTNPVNTKQVKLKNMHDIKFLTLV